jgi:hypothetical protein
MRLRKELFLGALLLGSLVVSVLNSQSTYAAQITGRSLTLQAGTTDGGSKAGGVVKHRFDFTLPSTATAIGSLQLLYCTTASLTTCTPPTTGMPTGVVTTSATLSGGTGWAATATLVNTTNGAPYLTNTATAPGATAISFVLNTVTNPTATNTTFFVRLATYASTNATGSPVDTGTVAASTATQIVLTGTMPESLIFCVGVTITVVSNVPNCSAATLGAVAFNQLFSPTDTATATSQFAASTNAGFGYNITVNGPTLTSGTNTIPPMTTSAVGVKGTGQFGMNLRLNTTATSTTPVGADISLASDAVNLKGQPVTATYGTVDQFKFTSGDTIAKSDNGSIGTPGPTNAQVYTAAYIVNVAGNQLAGTYTSTLTYICTATY